MLCIFTSFNFTRNQQLIRIKYEDHIKSMPTIGLIFFLAISCQHNISKIGITILSPTQLKLCNLQDRNYFKSTYLAQFNSLEKYSKQQISYFYQIVHFKMNLTKFGSHHLDTPSSRYEFLKFETKFVKKNNKENQISNQALQLGAPGVYTPLRLTTGPHGSTDPTRQ